MLMKIWLWTSYIQILNFNDLNSEGRKKSLIKLNKVLAFRGETMIQCYGLLKEIINHMYYLFIRNEKAISQFI